MRDTIQAKHHAQPAGSLFFAIAAQTNIAASRANIIMANATGKDDDVVARYQPVAPEKIKIGRNGPN